MAITTLSMVLTVFILNLHHITDRPVPRWVRRLVLLYLGRVLGFCTVNPDPSDIHASSHTPTNARKFRSLHGLAARKVVKSVTGSPSRLSWEPPGLGSDLDHNGDPMEALNGQTLLNCSDRYASAEKIPTDYSKDWRQVAEVLDRLFFWLFLMAILISTLVLFHPLTDGCLKSWTQS